MNWRISAVSRPAHKKFMRRVTREKGTWEAHAGSWRVKCQLHFASASWDRPSRDVPVKHSAWRILSVTFLPFTHTIYTPITYKSIRGYSERKALDRFSTTQHTHLLERESYSSLVRNYSNLFSFPLPLLYLERRLVPKHNPYLFRV